MHGIAGRAQANHELASSSQTRSLHKPCNDMMSELSTGSSQVPHVRTDRTFHHCPQEHFPDHFRSFESHGATRVTSRESLTCVDTATFQEGIHRFPGYVTVPPPPPPKKKAFTSPSETLRNLGHQDLPACFFSLSSWQFDHLSM